MNEDDIHTTIGPWKSIPKGKAEREPLPETTIDVIRGGTRLKKNVIDPPDFRPAKRGLRYELEHWTLGKLERLAKSRFRIRELTNIDLEDWKNIGVDVNRNIAQSVNASSEIEGEAVEVDKLTILEAPVTDPIVGRVDDELGTRITAIRSIYEAYLWMLCSDNTPVISYELILECHKRMFESTKGEKAGVIKRKSVFIQGGGYDIETLSPSRTQECLRSVCARFSANWESSVRYADYSRFLLIAEFILDFLAIHPFEDGNGRTARLLSTYLLEKAGYHFARFYPVDSVILEQRREYYSALYNGQKNWYKEDEDITEWVEFYTNVIFTQWTRAYERVKEEYLRSKRSSAVGTSNIP